MSRRVASRWGIFLGLVLTSSFRGEALVAEGAEPLTAKPLTSALVVMAPSLSEGSNLVERSSDVQSRPAVLPALYISFGALQMLDAHSTLRATQRGDREVNPVLAPFSSNRPVMFAIKAATTALTVYQIERLWKKNRKAAIITMVVVNSAYAALVIHNYKVSR